MICLLVYRELACSLLSKDFGLEVVLPVDRLVPMVPQRLNYIHWLEDLLAEGTGREGEEENKVVGVDIGEGLAVLCKPPAQTLMDTVEPLNNGHIWDQALLRSCPLV